MILYIKRVVTYILRHISNRICLSLRNVDGWVGVFVEFHYNTRFLISSDVLTAAVLKSRSPFLYLEHTLSVNGQSIDTRVQNL